MYMYFYAFFVGVFVKCFATRSRFQRVPQAQYREDVKAGQGCHELSCHIREGAEERTGETGEGET